jgi:hypothetical protein
MSMEKPSMTTLSWRAVTIFVVVEFIVVFAVLIILQFLSLTYYAPLVAGAVAGGACVAVNLAINRRRRG